MVLRKATSLLHWRMDPEIFPLAAILGGIGAIAGYTMYRKKEQHTNQHDVIDGELKTNGRLRTHMKANIEPSELKNLDHIHGGKKE